MSQLFNTSDKERARDENATDNNFFLPLRVLRKKKAKRNYTRINVQYKLEKEEGKNYSSRSKLFQSVTG